MRTDISLRWQAAFLIRETVFAIHGSRGTSDGPTGRLTHWATAVMAGEYRRHLEGGNR